MKVTVDRDLCIGAGNCVATAPTVFVLDNEKKAIVLDPSTVDDAKLEDAAESCPTLAIILEDNEGNQVFP